MAAFSKANAAENAGGGASLLQAASSGPKSSGSSPLSAAMGEGQRSLAEPGGSTSTSFDALKAGPVSTGEQARTAEVPQESQTTAVSAGKDQGAPGEVKRGAALKAAGSIAAKMGKVASGTVGNLAVGSWDVAKGKFGNMKASARDRVVESTGGKIAAAIKTREAANSTVSFGAGSLSAADEPADRESEVGAFRDRS
jgi:hypothetical protein